MSNFYVWTNNTVKEVFPDTWHKYEGCFFYDPMDSAEDLRWGKCLFRSWAVQTIDDVPKEFRLALLLMGIK